MTRTLPLLLLSAALTGCSMKTARFVPYASGPARFSAEVPEDWTAIENPAGDVPGVQFLAPPEKGRKAVRPYISVDFYARDSRQPSLEAYLAQQTRERPGRSAGAVGERPVGSGTAKEFTATQPLPQSPEFAPNGTLTVRTLLLPAASGFYELCYAAAEPDAPAPAAAFQRFLASFRAR